MIGLVSHAVGHTCCVLAAGHVLLERRLGCLEEKRNEDADMFIKAVLTCLRVTQKLLLIPPEIARPLKIKAWKELTWGFDNIYELGMRTSYLLLARCSLLSALTRVYPAKTRHWDNAGLMLGQRCRQQANIKPALAQWFVFAGWDLSTWERWVTILNWDIVFIQMIVRYETPYIIITKYISLILM